MKYGGSLVGKTCKYVPDLALMSFILFFGTYTMTVTLKKFKFSRYFPTKVIPVKIFCPFSYPTFAKTDFYTCTLPSFTLSLVAILDMSFPLLCQNLESDYILFKKSCLSLTFILHFPNYWWDLVKTSRIFHSVSSIKRALYLQKSWKVSNVMWV